MGNTQIVQKLWNLCDVLRDDGIIRCIKPQAREKIQEPAAGTASFLIAADNYTHSV